MLLEQFGADMSVYTRMVCDTVCITVPKAIVHCMVRQRCGRHYRLSPGRTFLFPVACLYPMIPCI